MSPYSPHYHRITGYDRNNMSPHRLDWAGKPRTHKDYPDLPVVKLPEITRPHSTDLRNMLAGEMDTADGSPDLQQLSRILYLANGLTARSRQANGYFYFRSPPSAGALYPNELYLVWFGNTTGLDAGVYFFDTYQRQLIRLRQGNFRALFPETSSNEAGLFLVSGIFFRSAWKYRNRAYRYVLLDGGHLIESTRLALTAAGYQAVISYDFNDHQYNRLLGVDSSREVCLAGITISGRDITDASPVSDIPDLSKTVAGASRVSPAEIDYKDITRTHQDGETIPPSPADMPDISAADPGLAPEKWQSLQCSPADDDPVKFNYTDTVLRRRSRRNFIPDAISTSQFSCLMETICGAYLTVNQESPAASKTVQTGFLCWNVDSIKPGYYLLDPAARDIGRMSSTNLIPDMTAACLNQEWLKNAAIHFLFMTDLDKLDHHLGARGYRYAMMTAGRLGHVIYLAATSMGLGCCGIGAFYDNEVMELLGMAETSALLYLVAVGQIP